MHCEICTGTAAPWRLGGGCTVLRCEDCGHVRRRLDRCAAVAREHPWGGSAAFDRVRAACTFRRLRTVLPLTNRPRVLEIGFGAGYLLERLLEWGCAVSGVEQGLLERPLAPAVIRRATVYFSEAEEAGFTREQVDLALAIHVVEHLRDPALVARKVFTTLAPEGVFYLITPNGASAGLSVFGHHWWNLEDPTHVRFFTPQSITRLLLSVGFREVRVHTPLWDSLTLEINSLLRALRVGSRRHGVLDAGLTKVLDMAALPAALLVRLLWPRLAPSMEVRAYR